VATAADDLRCLRLTIGVVVMITVVEWYANGIDSTLVFYDRAQAQIGSSSEVSHPSPTMAVCHKEERVWCKRSIMWSLPCMT
jgi:hypothetical protein